MSPLHLPPKQFLASPEAMARRFSLAEAERYTRWLATHHYENFHVVSFLLPRHLHQDFFNVYAFCRWADDLGDEIGDKAESLRLLAWFRQEVEGLEQERAGHPVFVALRHTVGKRRLPRQPFLDLIHAFRQDQMVSRYETLESLLEYCRYSANPVGRLVLMLCGYRDETLFALSDATCTALQLANFWQDVTVDWEKDRVYMPLEVLRRHGCTEEDIAMRRFTPAFASAMAELVEVARRLFLKGLPLARRVDRRLAVDLELFSRGGLLVLDKIARQGFDVLSRRPAIGRTERAWLLLRVLLGQLRTKAA